MPHRINAKADIGSLERFSDTYDMDNVYLSEEGWVYRHFKNSDRTKWWDEILVAGQVKPGMEISGVSNNPVCPTNPYKLGTAANDSGDGGVADANKNLQFEEGDGYPDYRYSDHQGAPDKVTQFAGDGGTTKDTGLYERSQKQSIAWQSINVEDYTVSEIPEGWTGTSNEANVDGDTYPFTGQEYQNINHYPDSEGNFDPAVSGPMVEDLDYTADPDGPADAYEPTQLDPDKGDNLGPDVEGTTETPVQPIVP